MADILLDSLETASPYIIGLVIGIALGAGYILHKDRNYKRTIRCATCRKKMFSTSQDVPLSASLPAELDPRKMEFARYLVATGRVSDHD